MSQVPTWPTSISAIIRTKAFARGVADVRAGRSPQFDEENDWDYERGRQWAVIAPPTMPLMHQRNHPKRDRAAYIKRRAAAVLP
jgi:hypothetical protein